jgi:hypothetical protein
VPTGASSANSIAQPIRIVGSGEPALERLDDLVARERREEADRREEPRLVVRGDPPQRLAQQRHELGLAVRRQRVGGPAFLLLAGDGAVPLERAHALWIEPGLILAHWSARQVGSSRRPK